MITFSDKKFELDCFSANGATGTLWHDCFFANMTHFLTKL